MVSSDHNNRHNLAAWTLIIFFFHKRVILKSLFRSNDKMKVSLTLKASILDLFQFFCCIAIFSHNHYFLVFDIFSQFLYYYKHLRAMTTTTTAARPPILPARGMATVKSVLSGDTVVLTGRATAPGQRAASVIFTLERITAPRMASKGNGNMDDPGAFPAREWLRKLVVGKQVAFETRRQGANAGDRVYGLLYMPKEIGSTEKINIAVEAVRNGHATPKVSLDDDEALLSENDPVVEYERALQSALQEAKSKNVGIHGSNPLVRSIKNAGEDFQTLELIDKVKKNCVGNTVNCVIEYVFDGSRFRVQIIDPEMASAGLQYANFTLIVGGVASPRVGSSRSDPPTESEPFADEAKAFVETRLLHRELKISLHGTDKSGICAVGTVHHPRGNIGVELLKNGLARVSDWSARMMNPLDIPAFRVAENNAKVSIIYISK
jgi:staphylococcal nuclease domain-containing protein 1